MITEQHGNLLQADAEALVNTVNTVGVMGKGIALQFKRAFPENYRLYKRACDDDRVRLGEVFVVRLHAVTGPRYIINFPTKAHWRANSKLDDIRTGLDSLVAAVKEHRLQSIALPPLGCGNGGLQWDEVYPLIQEAVEQAPSTHFMVFPPEGAPRAEDMPNRTSRPAMTLRRAALLVAFDRYVRASYAAGQSSDGEFSLVEAQKIVYFLQHAGWDTGFEFTQGHFGPYAPTLDQDLSVLEGHFISGFGDGTGGSRAVLRLDPVALEEACSVTADDEQLDAFLELFDRQIHGFESPYGMELLSTVHFIMARRPEVDATLDQVVEAIGAWSARKAQLFQPHQARVAYEHLLDVGTARY